MKKSKYIFIITIILGFLIFFFWPKQNLYPILQDGKWGYINKNGEVVIKPQFDEACNFSEGLARVKIGNKWGFVDKLDSIVIKPIYDDAKDFSQSLAGVLIDGKWGFINKEGEEVIPPQFDAIGSFSEGLASVMVDGKWGYVDQSGQYVIESEYESADDFSEGLAVVSKNENYGFINMTGDIVIPLRFLKALRFSQDLAGVLIDGKWGFINKEGEEVIPPQFDAIGCFSEGLASAMVNGIWGYIDQSGRYVIDPQYADAGDFSEGYAAIIIYKEFGYIDLDGRIKVIPQFNQARKYYCGLAPVQKDHQQGYIDERGHFVWPPELKSYNKILVLINKYIKAKEKEKWRALKSTLHPQFIDQLKSLRFWKDYTYLDILKDGYLIEWSLLDMQYEIYDIEILQQNDQKAEVRVAYLMNIKIESEKKIARIIDQLYNELFKEMKKLTEDESDGFFGDYFKKTNEPEFQRSLRDQVKNNLIRAASKINNYFNNKVLSESYQLMKSQNKWKILKIIPDDDYQEVMFKVYMEIFSNAFNY